MTDIALPEQLHDVKLQLKIKKLKELQLNISTLQKLNTELYESNLSERLEKLQIIKDQIYNSLHHNSPPKDLKKLFRNCLNEVVSVREGVFLNSIKKKSSLTINGLNILSDIVSDLLNSIVIEKPSFNEQEQESLNALNELQTFASIIGNSKEEFIISKTAIIPIIRGLIDFQQLKQHFEFERICGYLLLKNQSVVGFNKNLLKEDGEDVIKKILKSFSKKSGRKLQLVHDAPYFLKGKLWYWVMLENELTNLGECLSTKMVQINKWTIAK